MPLESPTAVLACRKAVSAACVENCRGEMLVAVKEVVMIDKDGLVRMICDEAVEGLVIWCSQRAFVASKLFEERGDDSLLSSWLYFNP